MLNHHYKSSHQRIIHAKFYKRPNDRLQDWWFTAEGSSVADGLFFKLYLTDTQDKMFSLAKEDCNGKYPAALLIAFIVFWE